MAVSNKDRIRQGLDLFKQGMVPFVEREFEAHLGEKWTEQVGNTLDLKAAPEGGLVWDVAALTKGMAEAGDNLLFWILANGIPSALGAGLALAHPVTILTAFLAAPITSLTPVIGAGYVAAFVQAWMQPPRISEIRGVAESIAVVKEWWRNRLLKVFLAFLLPGLGSAIGTWVGGIEILRNLH